MCSALKDSILFKSSSISHDVLCYFTGLLVLGISDVILFYCNRLVLEQLGVRCSRTGQ